MAGLCISTTAEPLTPVLRHAFRLLAELFAAQLSTLSLRPSFKGCMLGICCLLHQELVCLVLACSGGLKVLELLPGGLCKRVPSAGPSAGHLSRTWLTCTKAKTPSGLQELHTG